MYLRIKKSDFYIGSFLSVIINQNIKAKLIENGVTGKAYKISNEENSKTKNIFLKYKSSPSGYNNYWNINFTKNDIEILEKYTDKSDTLLCIVLTDENLDGENTEFLILTMEELQECIDFEDEDYRRLSIQKIQDSKDLRIYGSIRQQKLLGADNRMRIDRNRILYLLEDEEKNKDIWNLD